MTFTFRFTEEEVAHIRRAIWDKNTSYCIKGFEAKERSDQ